MTLVRLLWPEPAIIDVESPVTRKTVRRTRFIVIPSLASPKLLVPHRPRRVAARALGNYQASMTGRKRTMVRALSAAARIGLADLLPHRIAVSGETDNIERYLVEHLGHSLKTALYIGPPRAVQKPVLQLLTPTGETFAFAKVGVNDLTRRLVSREAAALRLLGQSPLQTLLPPPVLHHGRWGEHEVLVVGALPPGGSLPLVRRFLPEATRELGAAAGITQMKLSESGYWTSVRSRVDDLPSSPHREQLEGAVRKLRESGCVDHELEFGSWHGDWAPWNMTASGGRLSAWDWEHFDTGVPLGFDALHYDVQRLVVVDRVAPREAFALVTTATPSDLLSADLDPARRPLLVGLYIVEIALRYLQQGEVDLGGTALSRISDWLAAALATALPRATRSQPVGRENDAR
jgi:hypothetical protein